MRRPRSERMPAGQAGIWHVVSRCVRRQHLLEGSDRRRWLGESLASWLEVLAVDCLGYALMGNHIHLILRTRPDRAAETQRGHTTLFLDPPTSLTISPPCAVPVPNACPLVRPVSGMW
jgi:hypothetical protein